MLGGNGGNQIVVVGQLAGSPIGVFGGTGNDRIVVYVTPITFYNLQAAGQGSTSLLYLVDVSGDGVEQTSFSSPTSGRMPAPIANATALQSTHRVSPRHAHQHAVATVSETAASCIRSADATPVCQKTG